MANKIAAGSAAASAAASALRDVAGVARRKIEEVSAEGTHLLDAASAAASLALRDPKAGQARERVGDVDVDRVFHGPPPPTIEDDGWEDLGGKDEFEDSLVEEEEVGMCDTRSSSPRKSCSSEVEAAVRRMSDCEQVMAVPLRSLRGLQLLVHEA